MLRIPPNVAALIGFAAILSVPTARVQAKTRPEQFPLAKGSYWVYEGEGKRYEAGQGPKVLTEKITWRMEVVDRIERKGIVAAVVRGYPDGGPEELQVLLVIGGREFYRLAAEESILKRLRDSNDALVDLVREDQIELSLPLVPGKRFCEASEITRPDGYYCWVVEKKTKEKLTNVRGIACDNRDVYQIAFRTLPDHIVVKFTPEIGIVSYQYVHHGTVIQDDMKLVEFHDAAGPPH